MTFFVIAAIVALVFFAFSQLNSDHTGEEAMSEAVMALVLVTAAAALGAGYGLYLLIHHLVGLMR